MQDTTTIITRLQQKLRAAATTETKQWFENYLKGSISYYGVKTPQVQRIVQVWRRENQLSQWTLPKQLALCTRLISLMHAEEKFAAILYLQHYLVQEMEVLVLLDACEGFFEKEYFWDWSTADWFTVRVLSAIIAKDEGTLGRITSWANSTNMWQQRASIVSLRKVVHQEKYIPLIEKVIDTLVKDSRRFIQTGIGWALSDLSKVFPAEATQLINTYFSFLSVEVIDRHTKYLPQHKEWKKLKRLEN